MTIWLIERSDDRGKTWAPVEEMPAGSPADTEAANRNFYDRADRAKRDGKAWSFRLSAYSKSSGDRSEISIKETPYLTDAETAEIGRFAQSLKERGVIIQDPAKMSTLSMSGKEFACLGFRVAKASKTKIKARYIDIAKIAKTEIDRSIIPTLDVMASAFPLLDGEKATAQGIIVFFVGAPVPAHIAAAKSAPASQSLREMIAAA